MKRLTLISASVILAFTAISLAQQSMTQSIGVGQSFPPFVAKDAITGQPIRLVDFRGKVVIVDFWATWCGPCIAELPNLKRVYQRYKDRGLEIISISLDKNKQSFTQFVKKNQMNWPQIMEGGGWDTRLAKKYNVRSIPKMYVIDGNGRVVSTGAHGGALASAVSKALSTVTDPEPRTPGSDPGQVLDRSDTNELLRELDQQKALMKTASAPYQELRRNLNESQSQLSHVAELLNSPSGKKRAAVPYAKAYEILKDGRIVAFRDSGMGDTLIILPPPPPNPRQAAQIQAMQRVERDLALATEACRQLKLSIDRQLTDLYAAQAAIEELGRKLRQRSGDIDELRKAVAASQTKAEATATALRQSWITQLKQADKTLASIIGDDEARLTELNGIQEQMYVCQDLVSEAARNPSQLRSLKRSFTELWERLTKFTSSYPGLTNSGQAIPENPFAQRGHSDIQARVAAARALDKLEKSVDEWRSKSNDLEVTDHPALQQIAELQRQLTQAGQDEEKLTAVQEQYNDFCEAFLQQIDQTHAKK